MRLVPEGFEKTQTCRVGIVEEDSLDLAEELGFRALTRCLS